MCTIYMLTATNPLILSGCDNLKLAPYNSYFPQIEQYAVTCGLSPHVNLWDKPIGVTQNQIIIHGSLATRNPTVLYSLPGVPKLLADERTA